MSLSKLHFKPIIVNLCMEKVPIKNQMIVLILVPYVNIFDRLYLNPSDIPSEVIHTSFI
jgi:hypothetical protein